MSAYIEQRQPDQSCDLSLASIDVGFDPRVHGMSCALPRSAARVGYERDGEPYIVSGTLAEIIAELVDAGYVIRIVAEAALRSPRP